MSLRWSISFLHICQGWQEHLIIDEMCVRLDLTRLDAIKCDSRKFNSRNDKCGLSSHSIRLYAFCIR